MEHKPRKYNIRTDGDTYSIYNENTKKTLKPRFETIQEALDYIRDNLTKTLEGDHEVSA